MKFYDWFIGQCVKNGKSVAEVVKHIGISSASASGWKYGSTPKDTTLFKLEEYFGEKYEKENPPVFDVQFAEWYVKMCNKNNESPSAAALSIGCTEAAGCYWANGSRVPRKATLQRLEEYFGEKYEKEKSPVSEETELDEKKKRLVESVLSMNDEQITLFQALIDQVKGNNK